MTRNRVLVLLSAILFVVVSLLTLHLYLQGTREVLAQFQDRQLSYAQHLSGQIRFFFQARARGLRALSSFVSLREGRPDRLGLDIEAYARQIDRVYVKAVSLFDAEGKSLYSTDPGVAGDNRSTRRLLQWAGDRENAGKTSLTALSPQTQPLIFTLAVPLYREAGDDGKGPDHAAAFSGILCFTLDVREFLAAQLGSRVPGVNLDQVWIVDEDGTLLFQPDHPNMVFRNIHETSGNCRSCHLSFKYAEEMLAKGEGVADYEIRGHSKKIAAFAPMEFEGVSWVVVVNSPYDRVAGFVERSLRDHLFLLVILLAALTAGSVLIIRKERMKIRAEDEVVRLQEQTAERRKTGEAVQLERNKLKGILDSMKEGVYIADSALEMVYCNPSIERDYGPFAGRKCYEYLHGRSEACEWCRRREVFGGRAVRWEWCSERTGRTYDLLDTPFAGANGLQSKLCIIRDISDRVTAEKALRESEERYRMLVETMNDGLGVQDEDGVWAYVNDRLCEMLGYERDEMTGRPVTAFLGEIEKGTYRQQMEERTKGDRGFYELSWQRKDGQSIPTLVSAQAILDEQKAFRGSFAVVTEITERKRAEEALMESEKQLRHLSAQILTAQETERKRISRELHDELGQALTVMKLHMGFIEKNLSKKQDALRQECESGIEHIDQVIENVRRLSRDLSPIILEDFGLSAAIRWLVSNFAKRYSIRVTLDMADIDAHVSQDSHTMLYRIVQEALTNVGRHAEAARVAVTIKEEDGAISLCIEDDGKGFDAAAIMAKGDEAKGLGLITMRGRAQILGGNLAIQAEQGQGTRISVTIPVRGE